jgi:hypothetical protein
MLLRLERVEAALDELDELDAVMADDCRPEAGQI